MVFEFLVADEALADLSAITGFIRIMAARGWYIGQGIGQN
jgi:hypothetical protein